MLAEVLYCSFRCLRLVKNILSMWSLGILYQNGDTGQDSKETEQCFKSWDPLKRIWGHWRTVSHDQHFLKAPFAKIIVVLSVRTPWLWIKSGWSPPTVPWQGAPVCHPHSHSSHESTCNNVHERQMLWCFLPIAKGNEMYHEMYNEMLQSDHCPGYGASPINLLYTKQSPWMHTAVLCHLLKLQYKMHITCDRYWPDTEIKRLMSQAIVSPTINEICINQLNKHFYQHDQTQQIACVCLNTTFREMQKF